MSPKLTPAQRRVLESAARHMIGRVVGGDARLRECLAGYGYIEQDGYGINGALYKITDAGRRVVTTNTHPSSDITKKEP